jgi:hypothetical protein
MRDIRMAIGCSEAGRRGPFPRRVIYRKAPHGIAARIEGVVGGKSRRIDFPFERCK